MNLSIRNIFCITALGFVLLLCLPAAHAQTPSHNGADSTGITIHVKTKRSNDPREFVFVVLKDDKEIYAASPDFNGLLAIGRLTDGRYSVRAMFYDHLLKEIKDVHVQNGQLTELVVKLKMDLPQPPAAFTICPKYSEPRKDHRWMLLNDQY